MSELLGITFGNYHTLRDWNLWVVSPAALSLPVPSNNFVAVPGRNGYLDLSDALTGDISYETRDFSCAFVSLATPEDWPALYSAILNAIHGQRVKIVLDEDPNYYFMGRVAVESPSYDGTWQFTVTGVLDPYKYKSAKTTVTRDDLTTSYKMLTLDNDRMPVTPTITVSAETTLKWGEGTYTISAGTHTLPDICLAMGANTLKAKLTAAGTGSITMEYQEGSL